jgi:hypothetical protein
VGSDEHDAGGLAGGDQRLALGEKAVTRMDGLGPGALRSGDDGGGIQIGTRALRRPDGKRRVSEPDVQRIAIRFGIDRDRPDAEPAAGADDADRDLAAVGDQQGLEHSSGSRRYMR